MSVTPVLGILVGGGPAPGIYDGYQWLAEGSAAHVTELRIEDVSRIHWLGGSILRTSRTNPAKDPTSLSHAVGALRTLGITHLLCIGGDDTTFGAAKIAEMAGGSIQ